MERRVQDGLHGVFSNDDELLFGHYDSILGGCPEPVGLEDEIEQLIDRVMMGSSPLKAMVVCGMAGSGKTTLVKQVFGKLCSGFQIHAMVSIGFNFTVREILVCLLSTLGFGIDDETLQESELGLQFMNCLKGRSYFYVLDNIWDSKTLCRLRDFFPDDCNNSRIICVSRDELVLWRNPNPRDPMCFQRKMFLNDGDSWKLLHDVIFIAKDINNSKLEEVGKKIAKKCEGLPLAIISMGKLLCKIEGSVERWEEVLKDDDPFEINRNDGQPISKSLYLSYDLLTRYLKLCFLYMGVFPRDYIIKPSQLILLLTVEGLVPAVRYLDELKARSMVNLFNIDFNRKKAIDNYRVHFVFRSLCIREAENEKFCHTIKRYGDTIPQSTNLQQRLCIHNNGLFGLREVHRSMESATYVSSTLFCGPHHRYPLLVYLNFTSLMTLHALRIHFYEFPLEVLNLFRLKYLAITYDGELPRSIDRLSKLEFLILGRHHIIKRSEGLSYLPVEIWNLRSLTHIECPGWDIPEPSARVEHGYPVLFENLSTLSGVSPLTFVTLSFRLRNLKKLAVRVDLLESQIESFGFIKQVAKELPLLESFKFVINQVFSLHMFPSPPSFPTYLCELNLSGCGLPWFYMYCIEDLPNLKILKLKNYAFCGPIWEVSVGGCQQLEYLLLKDLDIEEWSMKTGHFPVLRKLVIQYCYKLQGIPIELADCPHLNQIHLYSNDILVEKSARDILHKKQSSGHDMFELHISRLDSPITHFASLRDKTLTSMEFEPKQT